MSDSSSSISGLVDRRTYGLLEQFLGVRLGYVLEPWPASLDRMIARICQERRCTPTELINTLFSHPDPQATERLIDAATVGYTRFFRHSEHFDRLRKELPLKKSPRIWCAGCSTGEEAWSITLLAQELGVDARIVATDINARAVEFARRGEYPVGPYNMRNYTVSAKMRAMVSFQVMSLTAPPPQGVFDFVFCRNVLIYFPRSTARGIVSRLAKVLMPRGPLVVAPVEALIAPPEEFIHEEPLGWMSYAGESERQQLAKSPLAPVKAPAARPISIGPSSDAEQRWLERAARAMQVGQLEEAEQELNEALGLRPKSPEAWFLLGEVLERRGERSQARAAFLCAAKYCAENDALQRAAIRRAEK